MRGGSLVRLCLVNNTAHQPLSLGLDTREDGTESVHVAIRRLQALLAVGGGEKSSPLFCALFRRRREVRRLPSAESTPGQRPIKSGLFNKTENVLAVQINRTYPETVMPSTRSPTLTRSEKLNRPVHVTKRVKLPSVQPALFSIGLFPPWEKVRRVACDSLPKGHRQQLADYLGVGRSTVSEMLKEGTQPSYQRVVSIIQFLEDRGINLD